MPKPSPAVIAMLRVSTVEQVDSGLGLAAQRASITSYAHRHGLEITTWIADEGVSGSVPPDARPALGAALAQLDANGGTLIIAKGDRIARRASDLLALVERARTHNWALVAVDGSVDTSSPLSVAMTTVGAAFAQLELDTIRARTREGMMALKESGVRLGRPTALPDAVRSRIAQERAQGRTLTAIADGLTKDGVPTALGRARWYPTTVRNVLAGLELDRYAELRRSVWA